MSGAVPPRPEDGVQVVDVGALLEQAVPGRAVLWSASNQLQTNVVTLAPGAEVGAHVEPALDVTLCLLAGALTVRVGPDDAAHVVAVAAPAVVVLPVGTRRSFSAGPDGATWLTAHRRRAGLMPRPASGAGRS